MRYWFVAASDRLGARRGFLVPTERRPTEAGVLKRIEGRSRIVELSGRSVDVKSLDLLTVRVVGDDARLARMCDLNYLVASCREIGRASCRERVYGLV